MGTMSKGMQQRLGIAQALVGSPRLLLLDEPTSALDPAGRRTVRDLLERLRERGVSVLLNSHLLSEIELVCDRVAIIDHGERRGRGRAGGPHPAGRRGGGDRRPARASSPRAGRDDAPRIVRELVSAGEEVYGVRVLTSSLEDAYLEAVGERVSGRSACSSRASPCASRCAGACSSWSACSRSPSSCLYGLGTWQAFEATEEFGGRPRAASSPRCSRARRWPAWPCSPSSSSAPSWPSSSRSARCGATPSAGCCSRSSCARCRAARCCSGAGSARRGCARPTWCWSRSPPSIITHRLGGWWPDRTVGPLLSLAGGVAIIAALSLLGSVLLASTANGIAVFMLFGAGLTAGLLGQIAEALGSDTLDDVARGRELGAAVRGALPGRAGGADRPTRSASRGWPSTSGRSAARESGGPELWLWSFLYLGIVGRGRGAAFARRDL